MPTPQINATGVYTVHEPFVIPDGQIYKCEAITGFEALQANNVDIFATYYEPNSLTQTEFATDQDNGVDIITLISITGGPTLHIPSSYIKSFPSLNAVPYNRIVISLDFGLLPDALALQGTIQALKEIASDLIGVEPTAKVHRLPIEGQLTPDQHQTLEHQRSLAQTYRRTPYAETKRLARILQDKDVKITLLEDALLALAP